MKVQKPTPRKMQAAARRVPRRVAEDYEEEPNMKLSSAFVVVLLLHVVAVGGIYAFNSIKARRAPVFQESTQTTPEPETAAAEPMLPASSTREAPPAPRTNGRIYQVHAGDTLERIASTHGVTVAAIEQANEIKNVAMLRIGQELRIPAAGIGTVKSERPERSDKPDRSDKSDKAVKPSTDTYTVVAGDNPVAIARRFGVNYTDLLKLNKIDDPRKLQIGQELRLPPKR